MTEDTRTRRAMLIAALLLLLMGTVSITVNLPYLPDGDGWDAGVPWVSAGCGVAGLAGSIWCLVQYWRATQGTGLVLRKGGGFRFGVIMLGVCIALLLAGLAVSQPSVSSGLPSLLAVNFARNLFIPRAEAALLPPRDAESPGSAG